MITATSGLLSRVRCFRGFMGDMSRESVPIVGGAEAGVEERGEGCRPVLDGSPCA